MPKEQNRADDYREKAETLISFSAIPLLITIRIKMPENREIYTKTLFLTKSQKKVILLTKLVHFFAFFYQSFHQLNLSFV